MVNKSTELQLIHEAQQGSKSAFDALVLKYQYRVLKVISRYVHDNGDALDITQDTFIKAYKSIQRFREDSSFYTWLYRIAVNTAKTHLTSRAKLLSRYSIDIDDAEQFTNFPDRDIGIPDATVNCIELESMFFTLVEKLPDDLRKVIMLREIEELTYEEIASVVECPIGTVRSRIFRAREAIEKKMSDSNRQFLHN